MGEGECLHKDHRARMRARFLRGGFADFAPHNVLELLLFYPLPRRDTNPLAHALLSSHGSVGAVLQADAAALLRTAGVGGGVISFFSALGRVRQLAYLNDLPRVRLADRASLAAHLANRLAGHSCGVAVLYLDNAMSLIGEAVLPGVSVHSAAFSVADIVREGLLCHAASVAVAHVHSDGPGLPLREDLDTTALLRDTLEAGGLHLAEHFIVGGGGYTSLLYRASGKLACPAVREFPLGEGTSPDPAELAALSDLFAAAHLAQSAGDLLCAYGGLGRLLRVQPARYLHSGYDAKTATLLALVGEVDGYVAAEGAVPHLRERHALGAYLCARYRAAGEERPLLLLFDGRFRHIATHPLGIGSVNEAPFSLRRMAEGTLFSGAAYAVLAHNHPFGEAAPSDEDRQATATVAAALAGLGVSLEGHYIVAGRQFCVLG